MSFSDLNLNNSNWLGLLGLVALLIIFSIARTKKENLLRNQVLPKILENVSRKENKLFKLPPLFLITLSLSLMILALARPQWGFEIIPGSHIGLDIAIAVDVSESMLAEDIKPDRLSFSRRKVEDLLNLIQGDRVGLISFAGASFIESPLTLDYNSIKLLSRNLSVDLVPLKGSNLESAALSAIKMFEKSSTNQAPRSKVMIIISDGEFEEEYFKPTFKLLKENNILPFLIVVGLEEGAPIPTGNGFKRGPDNKIIISKANFQTLNEEFSEITGLAMRSTLSDRDIKEIYLNKIKKTLSQSKFNYNNVKKWNEYFQVPLLVGLLTLFIAWRFPSIISAFLIFIAIEICFASLPAEAQSNSRITEAKRQYEEGNFKGVLETLGNTNEDGSTNFEKNFLLGNTYYRLKNFKKALEEYGKAQSVASDSKNRSRALFNAADTLVQLGQFDKSLEILEQAKKEAPKDKEIDDNINYVKKLMKNVDQQKKDEKQNQDNKKENDKGEEKNNEEEEQKKDNKDDQKDKGDDQQKGNSGNNKEDQNSEKEEEKPKDELSDKKDKDLKSPGDKEENKEEESPKSNEKKDEKEGEAKPEQKNSPENNQKNENSKGNPGHAQNDQLESQLESLEENTKARNQYRYKKALDQLEREQRTPSKMDW